MSSPTRPALALRCHGGLTSHQCVEQAVAAEHAGFSTVWFAENPFGRGAWPAATACAVATRDVTQRGGVIGHHATERTGARALGGSALDPCRIRRETSA